MTYSQNIKSDPTALSIREALRLLTGLPIGSAKGEHAAAFCAAIYHRGWENGQREPLAALRRLLGALENDEEGTATRDADRAARELIDRIDGKLSVCPSAWRYSCVDTGRTRSDVPNVTNPRRAETRPDVCGPCAGDGFIGWSWGQKDTCQTCQGSGRTSPQICDKVETEK